MLLKVKRVYYLYGSHKTAHIHISTEIYKSNFLQSNFMQGIITQQLRDKFAAVVKTRIVHSCSCIIWEVEMTPIPTGITVIGLAKWKLMDLAVS